MIQEKRHVQQLQRLAGIFGFKVRFCGLAGCGTAFVPVEKSQRFCCNDHKVKYNNALRKAKREGRAFNG